MTLKTSLASTLRWMPSFLISIFFIANALDKLMFSNASDKVVSNPTVIIIAGLFLLSATILFLNQKTIIIGASLLTLYMTCIVFIHMYKGKPYEVALLISCIPSVATCIRKPSLILKNIDN